MTELTSVLNKDTKVKVFSHNDLDGIGCGIVAKLAFENADVVYCGYDNIDERVKAFIVDGDHEKYDQIFITDISVNEEVETLINDFISPSKIKLLDHHATAMHLNENMWAFVSPTGINGKNSGTNMLFEYLQMNGLFNGKIYLDPLIIFTEKIRRYDTWEWKDKYDDTEASALNDLFWMYGVNKFQTQFVNRLRNLTHGIVSQGSWVGMWSEADRTVLGVDHDKKVAYINKKDKQMISGRLVGRNAGFVFAEQYISELGNELADRHPELDFIAILDLGSKRVSYRTVKNIDLGKDVASHFGGGGHPKASGSQIDLDMIKMVIPMVFGSQKLKKRLVDTLTGKGIIGFIGKLVDRFRK